jgi:hypothetical protein
VDLGNDCLKQYRYKWTPLLHLKLKNLNLPFSTSLMHLEEEQDSCFNI